MRAEYFINDIIEMIDESIITLEEKGSDLDKYIPKAL